MRHSKSFKKPRRMSTASPLCVARTASQRTTSTNGGRSTAGWRSQKLGACANLSVRTTASSGCWQRVSPRSTRSKKCSQKISGHTGAAQGDRATQAERVSERRGCQLVGISRTGARHRWTSIIHTPNDQVRKVKAGSVYLGYRLALGMWSRIEEAPCEAYR